MQSCCFLLQAVRCDYQSLPVDYCHYPTKKAMCCTWKPWALSNQAYPAVGRIGFRSELSSGYHLCEVALA